MKEAAVPVKRATTAHDPEVVEMLFHLLPPTDPDEEGAFQELVQAAGMEMHYPEALIKDRGSELAYFLDEFVREDEFTCRGCNLILDRTLLVDEKHGLCRSCSSQVRGPGGC